MTPDLRAISRPWCTSTSVGMLWMPKRCNSSGTASLIGTMARQGPHQLAQKSASSGMSLCVACLSNLATLFSAAGVGGFKRDSRLAPCWSDPNSATESTTRTKACSALIPTDGYEISCQKKSPMSIGDLFWLFFIFSAIQPLLQQKILEAMRVRKLSQLKRTRKSRVILMVHRQKPCDCSVFRCTLH
jgi:hypothetical protein